MPHAHQSWRDHNAGYAAHRAALAAQASYHNFMLTFFSQMGCFTVAMMTQYLIRTNPYLPRAVIDHFVAETLAEFRDSFDTEQGFYRLRSTLPLTRAANMQGLRDLVTCPSAFDRD